MLDRHQQRAADFRCRADQARESSRESPLPSVQERHVHAALRWDALAEMEDAFIKGAMDREADRVQAQTAAAEAAALRELEAST